ncbi:MAG: ribosomal protein S18-alanine N-acetyltransferase [Anaeroplasmataceae bacterium]
MVRKYTVDDIDKIVNLETNDFDISLGKDFYFNNFHNDNFLCLVLELNNEVIGFIASYIFDFADILNFIVCSKFRNNGYGRTLMVYFIKYISESNIERINLEVSNVNVNAILLYEKLGFKQIHIRKNYYNDASDALVLEKKVI